MAFTIETGRDAPGFSLPGVDGQTRSLDDYADKAAVIVVFTCNHCPTAIDYEDRLVQIQADYAGKGVQIIAINSNETDGHPTDSFEHMVERAEDKGFNFPYLRDESQDVAKAYGAMRTPHVFLLDADRKVVYNGRIDDMPDDPANVGRHDLREAIDEVLSGDPVSVPVTQSIGCNVKWWGKDAHWMPQERSDF
jgi:peroxiredoxin